MIEQERFFARVHAEPNTGCWLWAGTMTTKGGYGRWRGRVAHRVAYEWLVGPVPQGLELDHVRSRGCCGSACVNPDHLEPVTHRENMRRSGAPAGLHAAQTHCIRGHAFDAANTAISRRGSRLCRACSRARKRSHQHVPTPDAMEAMRAVASAYAKAGAR